MLKYRKNYSFPRKPQRTWILKVDLEFSLYILEQKGVYIMGIKPGPKRIAKSTGKPDRRQADNKETPGNTPTLKPHKHKKGD